MNNWYSENKLSSLRKYQTNPKNLLNNALTMFRSRQIKTAIVEGACDRRFLGQWVPANAAIRFDGFDGKPLVESVYQQSQLKPYSNFDFLYFFADVDFDVVSEKGINDHPNFIYNAYCFDEGRLYYNDLETYLINTNAFEKVLVNLDISAEEAVGLRENLRRASRVIGSLRAADSVVQREKNLRSSILNGLAVKAFFNANDISFDVDAMHKALPRWSNYPEYIDDLILVAERLNREQPSGWSLSRGHDLTEMIALYVERVGHRGMSAEKIELLLRLACEFTDFENSPMGRRLSKSGGMQVMRSSNSD